MIISRGVNLSGAHCNYPVIHSSLAAGFGVSSALHKGKRELPPRHHIGIQEVWTYIYVWPLIYNTLAARTTSFFGSFDYSPCRHCHRARTLSTGVAATGTKL
jgi:hypothetical protein